MSATSEQQPKPESSHSHVRHVVLVGLPGAGKSTVGRLAASRLGIPFVDVDQLVEAEAGVSIADIFAMEGEPRFRHLESALVLRLVARPDPTVIVPGGGWAAQVGNLEGIAGKCLSVYLQTSPAAAVERISNTQTGVADRPLIPEGKEQLAMAALLMNREPFYVRSDVVVKTDGRTVEEVVGDVVELARIRGAR